MSSELPSSRRSFLKKTAGTTALAGGSLLGTQPAAASTQQIEVTCRNGIGYYTIIVSDPNASAVDSESGDSVDNKNDHTVIEGTVDASSDSSDKYEMSGHIIYLSLDGYLDVIVTGGLYAWNGDRNMDISGQDADYYVQITGGTLEERNNSLESEDDLSTESINGTAMNDTDELVSHSGTIEYVSVNCEEPFYIDHPLSS